MKRRRGRTAGGGARTAMIPGHRSRDQGWYEELRYDEDAAIKIMQKCGADVSAVGESFLCPLPGHEERHP